MASFIQICGAIGIVCAAWNLFGDIYFLDFYTAQLSEQEFGKIRDISALRDGYLFQFNNENWWLVFLAQSGGWMYPVWAFVTAVPLCMGLSPTHETPSTWKAIAPCLLLAYGLCVVGGALHNAFSFLTALPSVYHFSSNNWSDLTGSQDFSAFLQSAQTRIIQHIGVGCIPGIVACNIASFWIAIVVHFHPTRFPRWFNFFNPVVTMVWTQIVGVLLPNAWSFYFVGCQGTWGLLMLGIGTTLCQWDHSRNPTSLFPRLLPPDHSALDYNSVQGPLA